MKKRKETPDEALSDDPKIAKEQKRLLSALAWTMRTMCVASAKGEQEHKRKSNYVGAERWKIYAETYASIVLRIEQLARRAGEKAKQ